MVQLRTLSLLDETHIGILVHALAVKENAFAGFAVNFLLILGGESVPLGDMLRVACTAGEI